MQQHCRTVSVAQVAGRMLQQLAQQHLPTSCKFGNLAWPRLYHNQGDGCQVQQDRLVQKQQTEEQEVLQEVIRRTHAAEAAMAKVLVGQQLVFRNRPDAAFFADQEQQAFSSVQELMPRYRVRPSTLLTVLQGAGLAAGAVAALAPTGTRNAVVGALQETLTDLYNDQLRTLRAAGLNDEAPDVRALMLKLRNLQRAAEGAPSPPDIIALQQLKSISDIGVQGVVGAVVKAAADTLIGVTGKM